MQLIVNRLCYQLIENHNLFENAVIIGLQPRGVFFAERVVERLKEISPNSKVEYGKVDPTFYRDDFRRHDKTLLAQPTTIPFNLEGKTVVLVDDVLYTGRTIRAGIAGIFEYGRPGKIELMVLVDRRLQRELPVMANYVGLSIDSYDNQKVKVCWKQDSDSDKVLLLTEKE